MNQLFGLQHRKRDFCVYKEWVVPTPGVNNRAGRLRIITGEGHMWFMPNHHKPPLFLIK
jgi:guanyl-specific ribonuclease Sa